MLPAWLDVAMYKTVRAHEFQGKRSSIAPPLFQIFNGAMENIMPLPGGLNGNL
jgi:hypothetical protein